MSLILDGTAGVTSSGTVVASGSITGITDGSTAGAGIVGQPFSSVFSLATTPIASATWGDLTSITVTAGRWQIFAQYTFEANGATITNTGATAILTVSGNNIAGLVQGDNSLDIPTFTANSASVTQSQIVSVSGSTTYYLKCALAYSVATPKVAAKIYAVRL